MFNLKKQIIMSYNRTNTFNTQINESNKTLIVADKYRTNIQSHIAGGTRVKVEYLDGTSRVYDKIKNAQAYINYITRNSNENVKNAFELC